MTYPFADLAGDDKTLILRLGQRFA
jgi:hypothetical protein